MGNIRKTLLIGLASSTLFLSCGKENPVEPLQQEPPAIEIKTGITNLEGQVTFKDNSTLEDVILNIVDRNNQSPVSDMSVTYWDGKEFEVFMVDDSSSTYLPSIEIYPHNSIHTIETGKTENGIYEISRVDEDNLLSKVIWSWRSNNHMEFSTFGYEKTVDYEEYIEIKGRQGMVLDLLWKAFNLFFEVPLPAKPSEIINFSFPEEDNPPQRWDIYTYNSSGLKDYFTMIPSNIPSVDIANLDVDENEISAFWEGSDRDTYDQLVFLPDNKDITKYLDGNSTSDLTYSHRVVFQETGEVYDDNDWTPYNSKTSIVKNISAPGDYSLEVRVKDEADNVGEKSEDFSIGGFGTITDPRDNKVYKIVKIGDQTWMAENLNYEGVCYGKDEANCESYGGLYSWYRASNSCPTGWHLPSNKEWAELIDYLGGPDVAGGKMKSLELWNSPNTGATNESGFTALPAGYYYYPYSTPPIRFYGKGDQTIFWSSTEAPDFRGSKMAYVRELTYDTEEVSNNSSYSRTFGLSVRCVQD